MISDYDIQIRLDPSQPVQGAKKITDAVGGIEQKAAKVNFDFKQLAQQGAQAWQMLSDKIGITDTAIGKAIGSATKFGALGAQIAGPWGAALGATISLADDLNRAIGGVTHQVRGMIEADLAAGAQRWNDALALTAKTARELGAQLQALDGLRKSQALAAAVPGMLAVQEYNEELARQKGWLEKLYGPQREYHANIDSLNAMLKAGKIDQAKFDEGLAMLNGTHREAAQAITVHAQALKNLADVRTEYFRNKYGAPEVFNEQQTNAFLGYDPDAVKRGFQKLGGAAAAVPSDVSGAVGALGESFKSWDVELRKVNATTDLIAEQFKSMATTAGGAFIDAIHGADVSAAELGKTLLVGFEKAIAQALILKALTGDVGGARGVGGSYGGLFGLLGFASGGVIGPRGGGAADTETAMFRVAPRETIRIHTPEQEAAYRNGAGGGATVNIVNTPVDDRALLQALSGPSGAQTVMNVVRSNRRAIKALLDG